MGSIQVAGCLMLPRDEIGEALLEPVEDQWFERKSAMAKPAQIAETEVAFANAEGGTLVVGLHGGRVEGTDAVAKHRNGLMQAAIDLTQPPVRTRSRLLACRNHKGQEDHLLVIEVEPSEIVHATSADICYLRIGDENRKLSFHQRQELIYDKGESHFDGTAVPDVRAADLDDGLLRSFASAIRHPEPARVLGARGLLTPGGAVTAAAYLLFGRHPQDRFPVAHVRVLRYRGSTRETGRRQELVDDRRFEGPIPRVIGAAADAIRELQPARRVLGPGGIFQREGLVPAEAWLEGLVNAVVHRSYSLAGDHIRIDVFNNRIEIESPGRFPGLVNIADPRRITRFARNPRIARVCADLHFGQELGEGIRRMFEEMQIRGLAEPLYRTTPGSVRLTLSATMINEALMRRLPTRSMEVIELLRDTASLSTGDIAESLGMSKPPTLRRLTALREAGLIDWVGKGTRDPRAYWRLHSDYE